ncbi:MAG TPA: hypothetical protein PK668_08075 [Myxococcota bacterium]|nr:hypothetical protein [Myxococcota bacterium]HRY93068.1 hypothetical protein [Myxococcota bacterium]
MSAMAWILALEAVAPAAAEPPAWTPGYIAAARVHLRAAPARDSAEVVRLRIGAEVEYRPAGEGGLCEVKVTGTGRVGFTRCSALGTERPTVEGLLRRLAAVMETRQAAGAAGRYPSKDSDIRLVSLVKRIFFLSPSLTVLWWACGELDYERSGVTPCSPDISGLFAELDGIRRGSDLVPLRGCWNSPAVARGAYPVSGPMDCHHDPGWDERVGRLEGNVLRMVRDEKLGPRLVAKPSLFKSRNDVYLVPGGQNLARLLRRGESFLGPDGRAEVRYQTGGLFGAASFIEFTKLLPDARAMLSVFPADPGCRYLCDIPGLLARFIDRPRVYLLTKRGALVSGSLVEIRDPHPSPCGRRAAAVFASREPVDVAAVIVTPMSLDPVKTKVHQFGGGSFEVDLDGDGNQDFAYLATGNECVEDNTYCCTGFLVVNIGGAWHLAAEMCTEVCT